MATQQLQPLLSLSPEHHGKEIALIQNQLPLYATLVGSLLSLDCQIRIGKTMNGMAALLG